MSGGQRGRPSPTYAYPMKFPNCRRSPVILAAFYTTQTLQAAPFKPSPRLAQKTAIAQPATPKPAASKPTLAPLATNGEVSYQLPTSGPLPRTYRVTLAITDPKNPDWIVSTFAAGVPRTVTAANKGRFTELATNLSGEYKDKVCCIVGARGELVRKDKPTVAALVRSIVQASDYVAENPNESAKLFAKYSPKVAVEDLQALLGTLTHQHHPVGRNLRDEVEFYARDFRSVGVLKSSTDPARLANHVSVDVLA